MGKIRIQSKNVEIIGGLIIVGFIGSLCLWFMIDLLVGENKIDLKEKEYLLYFVFFFVLFVIVIGKLIIEEVLSQCRKIIMDREGCSVSWFGFYKRHRWEDIQVVREDCWVSKRKEYEGVVFSVKSGDKAKKSRKIYESYDFLNCFYVIFYMNDDKSSQYPVERDKFINQLNKWGIEIEIGREAVLKKRRRYVLETGMKRRKYRIEELKKEQIKKNSH